MAGISLKIDVDTSDIDIALEKAERLRSTIEAIKALQTEIANASADAAFQAEMRDIETSINNGARRAARSFKP